MRRDEGSILPELRDGRRTGRWYARLRYTGPDGRHREKKRTCRSHAMARAAVGELRREIEAEAAAAALPPEHRVTYRELDRFYRDGYVHAARFVGTQKTSGFRQPIATVTLYMDRALAHFGDRPLREITYADLRAYKLLVESTPTVDGRGRPTTRPRSVADTNNHLKRIRRMFNVAVEQGWLDVNPFRKGSPLIVPAFETERTRTISPAEESRLIAACGNSHRRHLVPLIVFAVETACRRGEALTLRWRSVDLAARVINIEALNSKTLQRRMVPVSDRLRRVLVELRANKLRPDSLVFEGYGDPKRAFRGACVAAGLADLRFHDLRHTAITRMLMAGIPPPLVMKISGHSQMKTFLRYVNQSEASLAEIADILDRAAARVDAARR